MSGHSKWASIKHKKAAMDAKRGQVFTKLNKELTVAARLGGSDPEMNPRLRTAVAAAKAANMPADNIKRAVLKGTGELVGVSYEETVYEGYGPGGVAVLVHVLTDNKKRTVSDLRYIFSKHGGSLGELGCVAWMFSKKGMILINHTEIDEEELIALALEAGAEDVRTEDGVFEVITSPGSFESIKKVIEQKDIKVEVAEISMHPLNTVKLEGGVAHQMLRLLDALEEHEDVQNVYANFDIPQEVMEH